MRWKKEGPTHSQILGIIWISAALLLIVAVAFFSSRQPRNEEQSDSTMLTNRQILTQREDSVYTERYKSHRNQRNNIKKERHNGIESTFYSTVAPAPRKQPLVVELNSADTLTLQLLHGIGPAYARRIVRYRERLGGFVSTEQLLEVYGFTPELLEHIRPSLRLDSSTIEHIHINSIEMKQLARHPYVEYYQARDIVRLRSLGTQFHSADDLRAVPSMADSTLQRLLPYLDFSVDTSTK